MIKRKKGSCKKFLLVALLISLLSGLCGSGFCVAVAETFPDSNPHVSAGDNYCMAICDDGSLWGWGYDNGVHLGQRYTEKPFIDKPTKIMDDARAVFAGWGTTLVIKKDQSLWGWGDNMPGVGEERITYALKPQKLMSNVVSAASGNWFVVAVKSDASLWGWGNNLQVKLNKKLFINDCKKNSQTIIKPVLQPMKIMDGVQKVAANGTAFCVLKKDGSLLMHNGGVSGNKKIKVGDIEYKVLATGVKDVFMVSGTVYFTRANDSLWGVGQEVYKNRGTFDINKQSAYDYTPVKVMDGVKAAAVSEGLPLLILKKDGNLLVWGMNGIISDFFYKKTPDSSVYSKNKTLKLLDNVAEISAGPFQYLARRKDGSIWTWGMNLNGGIGDGNPGSSTFGTDKFIRLDFSADAEHLFTSGEQESRLLSAWLKEKEGSGEIPRLDTTREANWTGVWDERVVNGMTVKKSGKLYYGYDVWGNLAFVATPNGNKLKGRMSESIFELTMLPDGKSFTGLIYQNSAAEAGFWQGKRVI